MIYKIKMHTINTSEIPTFLLNSKKAKTITIPKEYFSDKIEIVYPTDLIKLLRIMNHWGVEEMPDEVYTYVDSIDDDKSQRRELTELLHEMKFAKFTKEIQYFLTFDKTRFEVSLADKLELLTYITGEGYSNISNFFNNKFNIANQSVMSLYAEKSDLTSIKLLHEYGCELTLDDYKIIISKGCVDCLKYYFEDEKFNLNLESLHKNQIYGDLYKCGHLECLKYLVEVGIKYNYWGHDECKYYMNSISTVEQIYQLGEFGHIKCLKYLTEHCWKDLCANRLALPLLQRACKHGHIEIVKHVICKSSSPTAIDELFKKIMGYGSVFGYNIIELAIVHNHFEILKLLWIRFAHLCIANSIGNRDVDKSNGFVNYAVEHENLEMVKFLLNNKFRRQYCTYQKAAKSNNLEIVKLLVSTRTTKGMHSSMYNEPILNAIRNENLEMVKYFIKMQFKYDAKTALLAAIGKNNVDILQFLLTQSPQFNKNTTTLCLQAVFSNSLECLKYLHENNHKWDRTCCEKAIEFGRCEIFEYLLDNGCPWVTATLPVESQKSYIETLKLAIARLEK